MIRQKNFRNQPTVMKSQGGYLSPLHSVEAGAVEIIIQMARIR